MAFILCLLSQALIAQPVACDGSVYYASGAANTNQLKKLNINAVSGEITESILTLDDDSYTLTCLGYNVRDEFIYALDAETKAFLRIDGEGHVTNLGVPENLNLDYEFSAGLCLAHGRDFVFVGHDPVSNTDKELYSINIEAPAPYAGRVPILSDGNVRIEDMVIDPITGTFYAFDGLNQQLVFLNIGGLVSSYQHESISKDIRGLFFNHKGTLFGIGNGLYQFDKTTGEATKISEESVGLLGDACGCPFTFEYYTHISPASTLPCTELTIEYDFVNTSGTPRSWLMLKDTFPEGFQITEVNNILAPAIIVNGVGSNILFIDRFEVLLGEQSSNFTIKLNVPDNAFGDYPTQALIAKLPLAFGFYRRSDNQQTQAFRDSSIIRVIRPEEIELEDYVRYFCSGDTAIIETPFENGDYIWNTGDTDAQILVTQSDWYQLDFLNECVGFKDSVYVELPVPALNLDLGEDKILKLGESLQLNFESNATGALTYTWESSGEEALSCLDCPNPNIRPLHPTTITLQITDEKGCTASDQLFIDIEQTREMYAATAFSPNADGINDVFFIQGPPATIRSFQVYNRWGALVFETSGELVGDPAAAWDGRFKGKKAASDLYIWQAELVFPDDFTQQLSGTVVLLK
jgi:gliding motility-associated-like protein